MEEIMLPNPGPTRAQMLMREAAIETGIVPLEPTSARVLELQRLSFGLIDCCNGTTYSAAHPVITQETDPKLSLRDWT